jgi:hypothetical protein
MVSGPARTSVFMAGAAAGRVVSRIDPIRWALVLKRATCYTLNDSSYLY